MVKITTPKSWDLKKFRNSFQCWPFSRKNDEGPAGKFFATLASNEKTHFIAKRRGAFFLLTNRLHIGKELKKLVLLGSSW